MKLITAAFAFGPPLLAAAVATVINPGWLREMPWPMILALGAIIGALAGVVKRAFEPQD